MLAPVVSQPADIALDGFDEQHVLGFGIRVVETEVAHAPELLGDAEVQVDGLGVADVEEAVGLGREAGGDGAVVDAVFDVLGDDVADEVFGHDGIRIGIWIGIGILGYGSK